MWKWTDPINIKAIIIDCDSLDDVMVYSDCYTLIQEIMKNVGCSTYSIIYVSKDEDFIKSMMQYHIGTIFAYEIIPFLVNSLKVQIVYY